MNFLEVEILAEEIRTLVGSRWDQVITRPDGLGIRLWGPEASARRRETKEETREVPSTADLMDPWLWVELKLASPMATLVGEEDLEKGLGLSSNESVAGKPLSKRQLRKGQVTPLYLFCKAHGMGKTLTDVRRSSGRVLTLRFEDFDLEIRLYPHGTNILVSCGGKKLSWAKVKPLVDQGQKSQVPETNQSVRSMAELWQQCLQDKGQVKGKRPGAAQLPSPRLGEAQVLSPPTGEAEVLLNKKKKGLERLRKDHEHQIHKEYFAMGEWIKIHQSLILPEGEWTQVRTVLSSTATFAENLQRVFAKAKLLERKYNEAQIRISKLEVEIKNFLFEPPPSFETEFNQKKQHKPTANYRTLDLGDGFLAYMGKSAQDNLAILRQAKSWDVWLHLRDHPGSHVVIRKPGRTQDLPTVKLDQALVWLAKQATKFYSAGDFVEIIWQEVRHVRPLKGAAKGLVTVHDPKTRRLKLL